MNSDLCFHSGYKMVDLNMLCFVDDLILLCKAMAKLSSPYLKDFNFSPILQA